MPYMPCRYNLESDSKLYLGVTNAALSVGLDRLNKGRYMRALLLTVLMVFAVAGCQRTTHQMLPNAVKLSGTLTNAGEPLTVEGYENGTGFIVVGFHPIVDGKPIEETTAAHADEMGKFEIVEGIEPGEYLITVRQWQPYQSNDLLKGKFAPNKSKIRRNIEGDTVLDLDVANPEG